jgi:hypothetical protein
MSTTIVYSRTHSVTYVSDNIMKTLKDIIRLSGLSPEHFCENWDSTSRALRTWLEAETLETVVLEVYHPTTGALLGRWDIDVVYAWSDGESSFWVDTEQIKYAIRKAGAAPSDAKYDLKMQNKPGRPDVAGWGPCGFRSTAGMVRQKIGSTLEHSGLGATTSYWRKT